MLNPELLAALRKRWYFVLLAVAVVAGAVWAVHAYDLDPRTMLSRYGSLEAILAVVDDPRSDVPKSFRARIHAAADYIAQWILKVCQSARKSVPEEVAIIGVDNSREICDLAPVSLSSIDNLPPSGIGRLTWKTE